MCYRIAKTFITRMLTATPSSNENWSSDSTSNSVLQDTRGPLPRSSRDAEVPWEMHTTDVATPAQQGQVHQKIPAWLMIAGFIVYSLIVAFAVAMWFGAVGGM
jgi:hypothetical protein